MASIKLKGDTSGEVTIQAPSVAGTNTLTLPATSSTLATQNALGVRNLIINGDMSIAQRGTSFTSLAGVSQYNLDRWETIGVNVGSGRYQIDQSTDTPTGFTYSQKISCTTAEASQDVNSQLYLEQQIEGLNSSYLNYYVVSPDTVTLSFWVKANLTGSYSVALKLSDNGSSITSSSTRIYPTTYSISSANTWEKKTITITLDNSTSEVKVVNNGFAVATQFWLGAGTSRDGQATNAWKGNANASAPSDNLNLLNSTANEWYITGVQLEANTTATPFENLQYGTQLALCQRYFERMAEAVNVPYSSGSATYANQPRTVLFYKTQKRAVPTLSSSAASEFRFQFSSSVNTPSAISLASIGVDTAFLNATGITISADTPCILISNSSSSYLDFSSEL